MIETAKDAAYTAVGLNVLMFDEISERLAGPRAKIEEHLDIARTHATEARSDFEAQANEFTDRMSDFASKLPEPFAGMVKSTEEAVEKAAPKAAKTTAKATKSSARSKKA